MIYIVIGKIHSGKTTALLDWSNKRNDVAGLLCPDGENGKRYFLKIQSKEIFPFEVETDSEVSEEEVVKIGNFKFLKSAFKKANDYLISIASESKHQFLIIDELGKLELIKEGIHLSAEKLIPKYLKDEKQHIILVVRDYLLDEIIQLYSITNYSVLQKEELHRIN